MDALLNRRGQYIPMIFAFVVSFVLLMMVVSDIYKVTRAKLQAQNIADAVALAVAALEAKNINVVLDRNEWLNHLYPDSALTATGQTTNNHQLPGISQAANSPQPSNMSQPEAQSYAQLIQTVNQAQGMFQTAYNQFLGAGQGTAGQNSGPGSLAEILSEIDGLSNDPTSPVQVFVYNNTAGQSAAEGQAQQLIQQGNAQQFGANGLITAPAGMAQINFVTEDVKVNAGNGATTLSALMSQQPNSVGWMRPKWDDSNSTLQVNVKQGQSETAIGAGAVVVKMVPLPGPIVKQVFVQAKSVAYVVQNSGQDVDPTSPDPLHPRPPQHFRPTYYVQLGYR